MDCEFASQDVAHFVTRAAEGGVEGFIIVANAVVAQHDIDGLLGTQGKVAAEARFKVEAIGHLDLIGTETEIGAQIHGKEGRNLGRSEVGLQTTKDLDVVANIIAGAMVGVTSAAVILEAGVIEAVEVLVTGSGSDEEVVAKAITALEIAALCKRLHKAAYVKPEVM